MTAPHCLWTAGLGALLAITLTGCGSAEDPDLDRAAAAAENDPVDTGPDGSESPDLTSTPDAPQSTEPIEDPGPTERPGTSESQEAVSSSDGTPTVGAAGGPIELVETSFDISVADVEGGEEPLALTIPAPGTYTFQVTNEADIIHALTIAGHGMQAATGNIQPGRTRSIDVRFPVAGEYDLFCPVGNHEQLGMDGSVVVGG